MSDEPEPQRPPPLSRLHSFSGIEFVPKRAMASFENLVALANYEEKLKGAKKIVWRDRGERPVEITDLWECLEHACKGGLRKSEVFGFLRCPSRRAQGPAPWRLQYGLVSTLFCC